MLLWYCLSVIKMPSKSKIKTHDDYCKGVCLLCFTKIKPSLSGRPLKKQHGAISGLDRNNSRLPKLICMGCYGRLNEYSGRIFAAKINLFDHKKCTKGLSENIHVWFVKMDLHFFCQTLKRTCSISFLKSSSSFGQ